MTIIGTWDVEQTSFMGTQRLVLRFTRAASGAVEAEILQGDSNSAGVQFVDIREIGNHLSMTLAILKPIKGTVPVEIDIAGDAFEGTAKAKFLPGGKMTGKRRPEAPMAPAAPVSLP
ncbi:MAG: hypothetical protein J7480_03385 [Microbacteriaceae bacterium]|nr:hypothetical protein [Microbacteriaceae bacterium]